jgi:outer membrane protein TolC
MKHAVSTSPGKPNVLRLLSLALGTTALTGLLALAPASAETLTDALAAAYQTNPVLQAQRAQLRATDEQVPQALSGWRPSAQAQGSYGYTETETELNSGIKSRDDLRPLSGSVTLSQNLFAGGRTVNATDQAEASVLAGRETLASVEQNTLLNAVRAYMNVIRDQSTVELNQNNLEVLKRQLEATTDRFRVGELTRTDTAQAEARLWAAAEAAAAAEGCTLEMRRLARFAPVAFDPEIVARVEAAAAARQLSCRRMPSGAGHDAQMFAPNCPTGMIFTPSAKGLSHNVREYTAPADLEAGANVLLDVVLDLAGIIA